MGSPYVKSWKQSAFKERNTKIRRLRSEGMKPSILCKRFGLTRKQMKTVLEELEDK